MGKLPLEGLKVLDFTWVAAGPIMTVSLADFGATVLRIEPFGKPDMTRLASPFLDRSPGVNRSTYFADLNRNKYSLSLDLNHPHGPKLAKRFVAWADVVVESFRPGTMDKWGLSYADLAQLKPDIIMLSTSMQGQTGPHASLPGYGLQLSALAGFADLTGWPDRNPCIPYGAYTDAIAPPFGIAAIMAAIDYRRRTGKGQYLDLSQLEASLQFLAPAILEYSANGKAMSRTGNSCSFAAPHGVYPCRGNDRWCAIAIFTDAQWRNLCRAMGNPEWATDAVFSTLLDRIEHRDKLDVFISRWTENQTAEEMMAILQQAGVMAGVVQNGEDLHQDPQLKSRGHFWILDHPEIGRHACDAPSATLSKTPAEPQRPAPCLGEHNEYACREFIGLSDDEFMELLQEGVLDSL